MHSLYYFQKLSHFPFMLHFVHISIQYNIRAHLTIFISFLISHLCSMRYVIFFLPLPFVNFFKNFIKCMLILFFFFFVLWISCLSFYLHFIHQLSLSWVLCVVVVCPYGLKCCAFLLLLCPFMGTSTDSLTVVVYWPFLWTHHTLSLSLYVSVSLSLLRIMFFILGGIYVQIFLCLRNM